MQSLLLRCHAHGLGEGLPYTFTSSNALALVDGFPAFDGLVTVTEMIVPLGAVTVVVTAPSGAVVTLMVSAAAGAPGAVLVAGLSKLSAVEALPGALTVMRSLRTGPQIVAEKVKG